MPKFDSDQLYSFEYVDNPDGSVIMRVDYPYVLENFLKQHIPDRIIEEAPEFYKTKFGKFAWETNLEGMTRAGGIDHIYSIGALNDAFLDKYAKQLVFALIKAYLKLEKNEQLDEEDIVNIAHTIIAIRSQSYQLCSRVVRKIAKDFSETAITDDIIVGHLTIPNNVKQLDSYLFYNCTRLTSIAIPSGVTSIGDKVFDGCKNLTSITVDCNNECYNSHDGILYNKAKTDILHIPKAIKGAITLPNGIKSITESAFSDCSNLTSIEISNSVTSIGNIAFGSCNKLKSIYIPNSVTSIGNYAFTHCRSLTTIKIPNNVVNIGDSAFWGCSCLTDIYCEAESKPDGWHDDWLRNCNATVHWGGDDGAISKQPD